MKFFGVVIFLGLSLNMGHQATAQELFVYPKEGQSADQQSRDRYDCHLWSVDQTGLDPTNPQIAAAPPPQAAPAPSSNEPQGQVIGGAARGAAAGAAIGAIAGDTGKGAAIGATAGALRGISSRRQGRKEKKKAEVQAAEQTKQQAAQQQQAGLDGQQDKYNRAMQACLGARGYSVN